MSVHALHLIIVFGLVVLVFLAFLKEWGSPDLAALSALGALLVSGILGTDEALTVFSNSAPIVIGCITSPRASPPVRTSRRRRLRPPR